MPVGPMQIMSPRCWNKRIGQVTNSERRIRRRQVFLPAMGTVLPDWQIIAGRRNALALTGPIPIDLLSDSRC